jgi:plastocyanin
LKHSYRAWSCVIVLTTAVLTVGCGGDDSKDASVSFSNPKPASTVQSEFTANVSLDNFEIDAANVGKQNENGKGHLHFSLDEGKYDTPKYSGENGKLAKQLGVDGQYSPSTTPSITYKGIPSGEHTLKVELANNDHSPTGTEETVKFTVEGAGDASASFTTPSEGDTVGGQFTAEVALENFELDAANVGKKNREGRGHLHFSLDGGKYDKPKYSGANGRLAVQLGVDGKYSPATEPKITYKGIPAGEHTLEVELANNDHSSAGTKASTRFTVEERANGGGDSAGTGAVKAVDFAFEPAQASIRAGGVVKWTNTGEQIHNVKQLPDSKEKFFSKALEAGASFTHRFERPGTYPYFCSLHPEQMKGTIKVTSG